MPKALLLALVGAFSFSSATEDVSAKVLTDDDACAEDEEECGVSLRQLRLRASKEQEIDASNETDKDCFQNGVYYLEPSGHPTMAGTHQSKEADATACQARCAKTGGCAHFSFWPSGGCLLVSTGGSAKDHHGVIAGPPSCSRNFVVSPTFHQKRIDAATWPTVSKKGGLAPPSQVTQYNGVAWEPMKIEGSKEMHIFAIGDWGGLDGSLQYQAAMVQYKGGSSPGPHTMARFRGPCKTKEMVNCFAGEECKKGCRYTPAVDQHAQQLVGVSMQKRAAEKNPDFILNVGDNFYWGGVNTECGSPMDKISYVAGMQFNNIFESVYSGPGIDGKPWFSVLGNHDWGGFQFNKGWDQQIAYTWASDRWRMPSLYWMQHVDYPDLGFSAEFFMIDSNAMDVHPMHADPEHNICGAKHNPTGASCAKTGGPANIQDCFKWMWDLWRTQQKWLEEKLEASPADWQVVVTHFACGHQSQWYKKLHENYGLDLLVTGHTHVQAIHHKMHQLGGMTCFITGGGGGITSEGDPSLPRTNQYGFFDLTISKEKITIESINYRGEEVGKVTVEPKAKSL